MMDAPHLPFKTVRGSGGGSATAAVTVAYARVASTEDVPTRSGLLTVDGVVLVANDKVLLKNQTTVAQNGIWTVKAAAWTQGSQTEIVHIKAGTANKKLCFLLTAANVYELQDDDIYVAVASTVDVPTRSGLLTVDGVVLVAGDKVLLKNQTTVAQNGVWVVNAGAWSQLGQIEMVHVKGGTISARLCFLLTAANTYNGECAVYG